LNIPRPKMKGRRSGRATRPVSQAPLERVIRQNTAALVARAPRRAVLQPISISTFGRGISSPSVFRITTVVFPTPRVLRPPPRSRNTAPDISIPRLTGPKATAISA